MTWIGIGGPGSISSTTGKRKRGFKRAIAHLRREEKRKRTRKKRAESKRITACQTDQQ